MTSEEVLEILEDDTQTYDNINSIDVFISPPDVKEDTDEDSGDEDFGGTYNNLSGRQLSSDAELVFRGGGEEDILINGVIETESAVPVSESNKTHEKSPNSTKSSHQWKKQDLSEKNDI